MHLRYLCLSIPFCLLISFSSFAACPVPQYPSQYEITHQSARLSWSSSGNGSPTYQVQWRPVGNANWNVSPTLTSTNHSLTGLTNNTTYEWRIRAICAVGDTSAATSPLSFQTKCDGPTYAVTGNITHQSARLSWSTPVSGAAYEVRWRLVGAADWTVVGDLTTTAFTVGSLANNATYEWQVRTVCSATAASDFTAPVLFQTRCEPPSNPLTSRVTVDAAELTWYGPANVRFDLQWRPVGAAGWTVVTDLNAREYVLTGLANNTTYEWQVRTACSVTEKSAFTTSQVFQTRCAVPTDPRAQAVMHNTAELVWSAATGSELQWRPAGTTNWNSVPDVRSPYRLTGLQNNTVYEWRVRGACAGGAFSDFTSTQLLTTRCAQPVDPNGYANRSETLSLYWSNSVGEAFEVQWRVAGSAAWSAATGILTTSYAVTGLTPNTDYEWRIRQVCSATETSDFTTTRLTRTVCRAPDFIQTDNLLQSSARLSWSPAEAGTRFDLQWRPVGAPDWTAVTGLTTTTYSLTGLASGKSYEWRVRRQCTAETTSDFTGTQSFMLQCAQPSYVNGYSSSPTSAYLEWFGPYTYPPYELQWRPLGAADWTIVSGLTTPTFTLTGLTNNTTYEYRVQSNCSAGGSTDFTSIRTVQTRCGSPIQNAQAVNVTVDQAELVWQGSSTIRYEIQYRDVSQTDWTVRLPESQEVDPYYGSSYGDKRYALYQLVPGRTYAWRVRTVCESGVYGDFVDGPPFTTACRVPLDVSGYASDNTTLTISWYGLPVVTNSQLQWRTAGETNWNVIDNLTVQTYRLTNLRAGVGYEYRVQQACPAGILSDFSAVQVTQLSCRGPQSLGIRPQSATSAQLVWYTYESTTYEVQYRLVGAPDWTTIVVPAGSANQVTIQGSTTTYSLTGLTAGGRYESRIRTVCAPGVAADYTSVATVQLGCPPPITPSVQVGATSARLTWYDLYGAKAYRVQWRVAGTADWASATVANDGRNSTVYALTGLMPNTKYEWRIAGDCGGTDQSAYGPTQSFQTTCAAVANLYVDGVGANQARLTWSVSYNTIFSGTYTVQYRPAGSVVWTELGGLTTPTASLTGLTTNVTYEYRVQAVCAPNIPSTFSSIGTFQTQCSYPYNAYATGTGTRTATVSWATNSGDALPVDLQWRTESASVWTDVPGLTGSIYSFTGLTPATTYVVRLRTVCSATDRTVFNPYPATFRTNALSLDLTVYARTASAHTAQLIRANAADGQPYVFQWRVRNAPAWNTTGLVTAETYLLTGLQNNTTYEIRAGISEAEGTMMYGSINTFQTYCVSPTYLGANSVTAESARLTWTDWQLPVVVQWRAGGAANWNTVAGVTGGTYTLTGLINNTTYEWRLQTTCSAEAISAFIQATPFRTQCRMPGSPTTLAVTTSSAQLRWDSPGPGSGFSVRYRPVGTINWTAVTGLTSATYTLTGLTNNTTYEWGVATTCGSAGSTAYTSSLVFETQCLPPVNVFASALAPDRAQLTWEGAGPGYQLDWRVAGSAAWSSVMAVTAPYLLTGLANNTTYEWRVRNTCAVASDEPFVSGYAFTTQCPFFTYNEETTIYVSAQTARLSWRGSSLTTYRLRWRPIGSVAWTVVPTGVTAPYTLTGLTNNTAYEWQIGTDCQPNYASLQTFQTRCIAPLNLRVDAPTTTSAQLRWDDSGEGVGYELQWRALGSMTWNTISNLTGTTYALTNLTNRTTYEWQVRGQCANGSAFETTVSFTTADDCALGLHTLRAGSWDDPAVWSCGRVPTAGERVQLRHGVTLPDGHTARARTVQYESGGKLSFGTGARLRLGE